MLKGTLYCGALWLERPDATTGPSIAIARPLPPPTVCRRRAGYRTAQPGLQPSGAAPCKTAVQSAGQNARRRPPDRTSGQELRARAPGKSSGQELRARAPGKSSGQELRARAPDKSSGQDLRTGPPGKSSGQEFRARAPGKSAGQERRARAPGKSAGQDARPTRTERRPTNPARPRASRRTRRAIWRAAPPPGDTSPAKRAPPDKSAGCPPP